uniref:Fibronectin type III domain-containing protein n=1 Tax=Candidatus Kentrum eta TaxID=2126337 RepID=A0A450UHJ1_9GAMM|nr:MAG: Fibronectin type III domain-containing protein [Candidatus Kentron sp. H]VFJ92273.1 MAG: Fibronectin type III domain-containing protein [Candidatus Kentron sp. H]VFK01450.1 MAG: Fibronectin type III domain-containing protein [Candidatus Kentron sp. H]
MATFPKKESDILALAQEMVAGFNANTDVYPAPIVTAEALKAGIDGYMAAKNDELRTRSAWEQAVDSKNERLQGLAEDMRQDLRYAENLVKFDDAQLRLIGWGGRKPRKALEAPGQVGNLTIVGQGEGWIALAWEAPLSGGAPAAYRVERQDPHLETTNWTEIGTTTDLGTTLADQERGKRLEFRVRAFNRTGEGAASNTMAATL